MKIESKPGAFGLLAGLLVFLFGLIIWDSGCAHASKLDDRVEPMRTQAQRADAAVAIYTLCGSGSGALVDSKHVVTAFHVVNCGTAENPAVSPVIVVKTAHGAAVVVTRVVGEPMKDVARLNLADAVPDIIPARIRMAKPGESLCAVTAVPERGVKCARVEQLSDSRQLGDVKMHDADYWFGNSGSGVYAEDGSLVGVVTRLEWCSTGDAWLWELVGEKPDRTCGGRVSSISDTGVLD